MEIGRNCNFEFHVTKEYLIQFRIYKLNAHSQPQHLLCLPIANKSKAKDNQNAKSNTQQNNSLDPRSDRRKLANYNFKKSFQPYLYDLLPDYLRKSKAQSNHSPNQTPHLIFRPIYYKELLLFTTSKKVLSLTFHYLKIKPRVISLNSPFIFY